MCNVRLASTYGYSRLLEIADTSLISRLWGRIGPYKVSIILFLVARSASSACCAFARAPSAARASVAARSVITFSALAATCFLCQLSRAAFSARPRLDVLSLASTDSKKN
jgi:hypothetical protein